MCKIDNFKQIRELLTFDKENNFYFIEIIKRRKDNPRMKLDSKFIKSYYVWSHEGLDAARDEILCYCELHNARAYIKINVRNSDAIALHALKRLADLIASGNTKSITRLSRLVCCENHSDANPKFMVDIDSENDLAFAKSVIQDVWDSRSDSTGQFIAEIPTPNGWHLITSPFDMDRFQQSCPTIAVMRDGSTLLCTPIISKNKDAECG
jgi:hypothetical protein